MIERIDNWKYCQENLLENDVKFGTNHKSSIQTERVLNIDANLS